MITEASLRKRKFICKELVQGSEAPSCSLTSASQPVGVGLGWGLLGPGLGGKGFWNEQGPPPTTSQLPPATWWPGLCHVLLICLLLQVVSWYSYKYLYMRLASFHTYGIFFFLWSPEILQFVLWLAFLDWHSQVQSALSQYAISNLCALFLEKIYWVIVLNIASVPLLGFVLQGLQYSH